MDNYGLNMKGPFYDEPVATLPAWTPADEGRCIYALDTHKLYYGSNTGWEHGISGYSGYSGIGYSGISGYSGYTGNS